MSYLKDSTKSLSRQARLSVTSTSLTSPDTKSIKNFALYQALVLEGLCTNIILLGLIEGIVHEKEGSLGTMAKGELHCKAKDRLKGHTVT